MTTALANTRTRKQWAKEINSAWFKSVDDVCDVAELCASSHADIGAAEYKKMSQDDLQFSKTLANSFRQLGERPDILRYARAKALPSKYSSIFGFLKVDEKSLLYAIKHGLVDEKTNQRRYKLVVRAG